MVCEMRKTNRVCTSCDLIDCQCGKLLTFCNIYSKNLGMGPLHRTLEEAEQERRDMLAEDPSDTIDICQCKMMAEEYAKLPEHQGY
jgi:hypothetical protein